MEAVGWEWSWSSILNEGVTRSDVHFRAITGSQCRQMVGWRGTKEDGGGGRRCRERGLLHSVAWKHEMSL